MTYRQWIATDLKMGEHLEQMLAVPVYKARQILKQSSLDNKRKAEVWESYKAKRYLIRFEKHNTIDTKLPTII